METLQIVRHHCDAQMPRYATAGAAAFDLHSVTEGIVSEAAPLICDTGLKVAVPEGHVLLIFPRSGHAFNSNVRLANCVGVIDSDYRGPLKVKLTADVHGRLVVTPGMRIAQAMVVALPQLTLREVSSLPMTERGEQGFGSTGQ